MQKHLAVATVTLLNLFNVVDLATTYVALENGNFQELNPIILGLYNTSPVFMVLFKLAIVLTISLLLLRIGSMEVGKILYKGIYIGLFVGVAISATVLGYVSMHNIILLMNV